MLRGASSALPPTTIFVLSLIEYKQAEKTTFLHSCNVADLSTFARFAKSLNTSANVFVFMAIGSEWAGMLKLNTKQNATKAVMIFIFDLIALFINDPRRSNSRLLWCSFS